MSDLERALAFLELADHAATRVEPTPLGTLFLTPELARRWDSNYLLVRDDADADALVEAAEPLFAAAGLSHRKLVVRDDALGRRLWRALPPSWLRQRLLVMTLQREPERDADLAAVREVAEAALRPARAAITAAYPWGGDPEVQRQLLDAKLLAARAVETRFFAAYADGAPASFADLYVAGGVAQIEDVATVEAHRNRGLATAVVLAAMRAAREAGAELVFLLADEDDWPAQLYRRLGFDGIGRVYDFVRPAETDVSGV